MKELPSPIHAERMKVAQFGSLERFQTEEPVFAKDTLEASEAGTDALTVTGNQPTQTTDQTDQRDVEKSSDVDSNEDLTPVDVATPIVNNQDHDIKSGLPSDHYVGSKLCPIERLLKARVIKCQRFYQVKWGIRGIQCNSCWFVVFHCVFSVMFRNAVKTISGRSLNRLRSDWVVKAACLSNQCVA